MPELDEAEVQALITQLDEAIPREGAVVVEEDGEHYDEPGSESPRQER